MKKYFVIIVLLLLPLIILAAYNTVQFTEDTNIYLGNGLTLQILAGSNVAEMTVGLTSVTFDMESGSSVTVRSYDKKYLTNNLGIHTSCLENYSQVSLTSNTAQSFSITPNPVGRCEGSSRGSQIMSLVSPLEENGKEEETVAEIEEKKEVTEQPIQEEIEEPQEEGTGLPEEVTFPEEKIPQKSLLVSLDWVWEKIKESALLITVTILCLAGLVVIRIKKW